MVIEIRGIADNHSLRAGVRKQLSQALERLPMTPLGARVLFVDENGPKGGADIRCTLTVRLPFQRSVRVEHMARTHRQAFDEAFAVLERQLARDVERARQRYRRPKKYYVAKRLLAEGGPRRKKRAARATAS
jgi:ribosome-associated translation inhibitor RaiA